MMKVNKIELPTGVTTGCKTEEIERMIDVTMGMTFMWEHLCGHEWRNIITREKLRGLLKNFNSKFSVFGHFVDESVQQTFGTSLWNTSNTPVQGTTFGNLHGRPLNRRGHLCSLPPG